MTTESPEEIAHVGYRFWAVEEQPEGVAEQGLVIADSKEEARALVKEHVGTHAEWVIRVESKRTSPMPTGVFHISPARKRSPMMCANDLYAMNPCEPVTYRNYDPHGLRMSEIDSDLIPDSKWDADIHGSIPKPAFDGWEPDDVSFNVRVYTRTLYDPYIDGSRCCTLETLWFDDKPIAISQIAGRPDHRAFFITDIKTYGEAVAYLLSLYQLDSEDHEDDRLLDPDKPMRALTCFYGTDTMLERK